MSACNNGCGCTEMENFGTGKKIPGIVNLVLPSKKDEAREKKLQELRDAKADVRKTLRALGLTDEVAGMKILNENEDLATPQQQKNFKAFQASRNRLLNLQREFTELYK